MSDAAIRAASPSDLDELTRLLAEMKRHHRERDPENRRFEVPVETLKQSVRSGLRDPAVAFLVAERPGGLAGFVKLRFVEKSWGRACEVDSLMVEEQHRNCGLGAALMAAAEARARAGGAAGMRLDVSVFNGDAARFYEQLGYEHLAARYGKEL